MPVYDVRQIVGKTLVARKRIPFFYKYVDGRENKPDGYFQRGNTIGSVQSWLDPKPPSRNKLYWAFVDSKGTSYYVPHAVGSFDLGTLKDQGVKSELELIQDANKTPDTWQGVALRIGIVAVAAWAAVTFLGNATGARGGRNIIIK